MIADSSPTEGETVSKSDENYANTFQIKTEYNQILQVHKLTKNAKIPTRATPDSIGYDLYATNNLQIPGNDNKLISTGLAMTPPKDTYIRIAARSGLALKNKLQVDAGVIDPDYTGEIKVLLSNRSTKPFQINQGDKIAQIVLEKAALAPIKVVNQLEPSERGNKGFGSSNKIESDESQAQANVCDSNPKTSKYQKKNHEMDQSKLIVLPKIAERPPGCSFIGTTPTTALVKLGDLQGPSAKIIIDSGSDITLVAPEILQKMSNPPRTHQGKQVRLSQVTAKTTISGYVDLPLIFNTDQGPVQANVEAYLVKGMSTPLILGNDFADQYSLSIMRDNGQSTLKFAETGRTMKLENSTSDSHLSPEVKAFLVKVKKTKHKIKNKSRQKERKDSNNPFFFSVKEETIQPFSSKIIKYQVKGKKSSTGYYLEVDDFERKELTPLQLTDAIVNKSKGKLLAFNASDCPIKINKGEKLGKVLEPNILDTNPDSSSTKEIEAFVNFTKAVMKAYRKEPENQTKEEREHAENQEEQPSGPKTAEVPEFEDIPKELLTSSLDINSQLTKDQRSKCCV